MTSSFFFQKPKCQTERLNISKAIGWNQKESNEVDLKSWLWRDFRNEYNVQNDVSLSDTKKEATNEVDRTKGLQTTELQVG